MVRLHPNEMLLLLPPPPPPPLAHSSNQDLVARELPWQPLVFSTTVPVPFADPGRRRRTEGSWGEGGSICIQEHWPRNTSWILKHPEVEAERPRQRLEAPEESRTTTTTKNFLILFPCCKAYFWRHLVDIRVARMHLVLMAIWLIGNPRDLVQVNSFAFSDMFKKWGWLLCNKLLMSDKCVHFVFYFSFCLLKIFI